MKKLLFIIYLIFLPIFVFAQPVYTEKVSYQVEVTESGNIQVRKATRVFKDGVEISKSYHRKVLTPGSDLTNEPDKVKKIANVVWTKKVIDEYKAEEAKRNALTNTKINTNVNTNVNTGSSN